MKPFTVAFTSACPHGLLAGIHLPDSPDPVPEGALGQLSAAEREAALAFGGYRQVSFVGGRLALHRAARGLGLRLGPVLPGAGGEPELPPGLAASVTHKRRLAVALAGRSENGHLGVDLEDLLPERMGVAARVLRPEELAEVEAMPPSRRWMGVVIRFSLKEALYKALYPEVRRYVDFMEASVAPEVDGNARLTLHLERGEGPFDVEARYTWLEGQVLSFVRLRRG